MAKPGNTGIKRLINAGIFSKQGFIACFKHEEAFRQECILLPFVIGFSLYFGQTGLEKAVMIGAFLLILLVELLNSAIEAVVDRIGAEYHELSGRAKDIGSAAVLLAIANCLIIWSLICLFR